MTLPTATLATEKRALELGAGFIEHDLRELRKFVQNHDGMPSGTSHEGDLMKAMEWASAIAILRTKAAMLT